MRAARGGSLEQQRLEIVEFERLVHHLAGAQIEGVLRDLRCAVSRHQDDSAAGRQPPNGSQQRQIMRIRKLIVEHHYVNRPGGVRQRSHRGGAAVRFDHGVAVVAERLGDRPPHEPLVLDHEHAQTGRNSCHKGKPRTRSRGAARKPEHIRGGPGKTTDGPQVFKNESRMVGVPGGYEATAGRSPGS